MTRHAIAVALLDIPNERSSHTVATPRGGGLAIVATVLAGMAAAHYWFGLPMNVLVGLGGGGIAIALVGGLDDRSSLSPLVKGGVQLASSAWAVYWLGGLPELTFANGVLHLGVLGSLIAVLALAWSTNLFNFMDGIDGIAAGEAITVGAIAASLMFLHGEIPLALLAALVASASSGFLAWNWSPAKIFMGDVGSGFLGFILGGLAIASQNAGSLGAIWWLVLASAFFIDATFTLFRRMLRGERLHTAHRNHAYQRAVQAGMSHSAVTGIVIAFNIALGLLVFFGSQNDSFWWFSIVAIMSAVALYAGAERLKSMP